MTRSAVVIVLVLYLNTSVLLSQDDSSITVMTYNIRLDVLSDGENRWDKRKEMLASLIRFHNPDIVGLQEALRHQIDYLQQVLPEYGWFGIGRDDGKDAGEFMAVFYRKDQCTVLRSSTFWCSPTPSLPGLGWDAACNRVVTWGKFRLLNQSREFYLFNTHLDHVGVIARKQSAQLVMDSVNAITGQLPVIVMGDFNSVPSDGPYQTMIAPQSGRRMLDAFPQSRQPHYGPRGTFNAFNIREYANEPIDYIFVSEGTTVLTHVTLTDSFHGRLPSDHFPVITKLILPAAHKSITE